MNGGITFRDAINNNKKFVIEFLVENGKSFTTDICHKYKGEKELPSVRKALNELRNEGKVETDDVVKMWKGKCWGIKTENNE